MDMFLDTAIFILAFYHDHNRPHKKDSFVYVRLAIGIYLGKVKGSRQKPDVTALTNRSFTIYT
jgi:hypothetical protein